MSRDYFRYLARSCRVLIAFFLAVYLSISLLFSMPNEPALRFFDTAAAAGFLSFCACHVLPVLLFSFVHRRSSADVFHALPISRRSHRLTILAFCFTVIFGYFLIAVMLGWLLYGIGNITLGRLLGVTACGAFMIFAMLVINSCLYLLGNNILDGLVILAAYTFFFVPCFIAESVIVEQVVAGTNSFLSGPVSLCLSPGYVLLSNFLTAASVNRSLLLDFNWLHFGLGCGYLLLAWFGLKKEFDERKSERAEAISDHLLAYPLVINMYAVVCLLVIATSVVTGHQGVDVPLGYLALLVCYIAGTFLYRRRIELDLKRIGIYAAEALAAILFMGVCWQTKGFGMAYRYPMKEGDELVYEYFAQVDAEHLGQEAGREQEDVGVNFTVSFPTRGPVSHPELLDLLEKKRHEAIEAFYRKEEQTTGNFRIYNVDDTRAYVFNEYVYRQNVLFSEEELQEISRYTDVSVHVYDHYDIWPDGETTLSQYLAWKGKQAN